LIPLAFFMNRKAQASGFFYGHLFLCGKNKSRISAVFCLTYKLINLKTLA